MQFYRDGVLETIDRKYPTIVTREGHTVEVYSVNGNKKYFATLAGSHYCAHGVNIAEAITDAIWKDPKQRPSLESLKKEIQKQGRDRKISLQEFRLLTGACLEGCRIALKRADLDGSPMTADAIEKYFPDWGRKLKEVLCWQAL